jgi:hypothetical protein
MIANAIMAQPQNASINLQILANLLGIGKESVSSGTSQSSSESVDPTAKYQFIAGLL